MIPEGDAFAFANDFISVRKRIADAAGKPLMLEETGMNVSALLFALSFREHPPNW